MFEYDETGTRVHVKERGSEFVVNLDAAELRWAVLVGLIKGRDIFAGSCQVSEGKSA